MESSSATTAMPAADSHRGLPACGGRELRQFVVGGLAALERCAAAVDALNVFPVPDADTGSNLLTTLRRAIDQGEAPEQAGIRMVAGAFAAAALRGARGNSGAMFAQIWAGFAAALDSDPAPAPLASAASADEAVRAAAIDPPRWAAAWQAGAAAAWDSVASPVEGTLLTVARTTGQAAVEAAGAGGDLLRVWQAMADAADRTVAETPRLLPLLERARVVDAGALGLALFLRGGLHAFTGAPLPDPAALVRPSDATRHVIETAGFARYCTQLTLRGAGTDRARLHAAFAGCGDSLDIAIPNPLAARAGGASGEDPSHADACVHVHIHTDRPDDVLARAATLGAVDDVKVEDMEAQRARYVADMHARAIGGAPQAAPGPAPSPPAGHMPGARGAGGLAATLFDAGDTDPPLDVALVAIVSGAGMRRLFESLLGVAAVVERRDGSRSARPGDARGLDHGGKDDRREDRRVLLDDLRAALDRVTAPRVIILANDAALLEDVREAAAACGKQARVVPTANAPQGVAAALAFSPAASLASNAEAMAEAARVSVTVAVSASGDALPDAAEMAAREAGAALGADRLALITIYHGAGVAAADADALASRLRQRFPDADVETFDGGQSDCPLWLAFDLHADPDRH